MPRLPRPEVATVAQRRATRSWQQQRQQRQDVVAGREARDGTAVWFWSCRGASVDGVADSLSLPLTATSTTVVRRPSGCVVGGCVVGGCVVGGCVVGGCVVGGCVVGGWVVAVPGVG